MIKEAIFHQPESEYCYTVDGKEVIIRLKCKRGDLAEAVLFYGDRFDSRDRIETTAIPMEPVLSDDHYDMYECRFASKYKRVCYYFFLVGNDGEQAYLFSSGFSTTFLYDRQKYFHLPYLHVLDTPMIPRWFLNSIMYQIFPDSFATAKLHISGRGQKTLTKDGVEVESKLGGTLKGITESLDYIDDLGVSCIYMTPIFTAESYHKYDTVDYMNVDPLFGSNEDLVELVSECHKRDIKVVLDVVFNHSGTNFFAFRDIRENSEKSEYKDWYMIKRFPLINEDGTPNYECFGYHSHMPKFNMDNPEVRSYLVDVAKHWVNVADVDGYRLDVANEVPRDFWSQFRYEIDKIKKDFVFIGEAWHDANAWLGKSVFHSTMNYNLMYLIWEFFGYRLINAAQAEAVINRLLMRYRHDLNQAQMNFLDSHDVTRFIDIARFDKRRLKLAAAFLMTFIGVPSIYYGTELALDGPDINEARRMMPWKDVEDSHVLNHFKKLISLRKAHPELAFGNLKTLIGDPLNDILAYSREYRGKKIVVVFANNKDSVVRLSTDIFSAAVCVDLLTGETFSPNNGYYSIEVKGVSARILAKAN